MPDLTELLPPKPVGDHAPPVKLWDGTILDTATAAGDLLRVALPGADNSRHEHGPCPWMPRRTAMPTTGDRCLVAFDDDGNPWIVVWEGPIGGVTDIAVLRSAV